MALIDAVGAGPVAIDTSIFIYFTERHPRYLPVLRTFFAAVDEGALAAVTSALTLLEVLVLPYRAGDHDLAARYETILSSGRGLTLVPIDSTVLRLAARIRADHSIPTPDALQLATALLTKCTAFLTNDAKLRAVRGNG